MKPLLVATFLIVSVYSSPQFGLGGLFGGGHVQQAPPNPLGGLFGAYQSPSQPIKAQTPKPEKVDMKTEVPKETRLPCADKILTQVKPAGKVTPENNYWEGTLDLSSYQYLKVIKLFIEVDEPAEIQVDSAEGEISGPSKGTMFRVRYNGSPAEVKEVKFKIIGTDGAKFPNLVVLLLNNRNICRGLNAWVTNLVEDLATGLVDATSGINTLLGDNLGLNNLFQPNQPNYAQAPNNGGVSQDLPNRGSDDETAPTTARTTTVRTKPTRKIVPGCGRRQVNQQAYVTHAWDTKPGDYPWHVALYHKEPRSSTYACGGTLINDRTVITAAHCVYSYGKEMIPERVSVQLGKFNLNLIDSNTVEHLVYKIIVHPEYSSIDYQDDIAILKLAEKVDFNDYVQPACLWKQTESDLKEVIGKNGIVVGWGLTEEDHLAEVLKEGRMPVVDFITCLDSNRDFFGPFLSDYNYCAGFRNGTSVCNGDSGGGMFFDEEKQYYLRGIVSFSSVREDRDVCNPKNYVIFTDVAKYLDWIDENTK